MEITTKIERFTNPLYLDSGRIIEPYEIIYETYGELNEQKDNVILVTHALSGSHHVAGRYDNEAKAGWWDKLIGENKAIDTKKYFVICTNSIGSCFGSTGPASRMYPHEENYRFNFPVITIKDMVKAQRILLHKLGISNVKAIIGGSMGGMQALSFAVAFPNFAKHIIALATTHATRAWIIAFNKVATEAIIKDPAFKNGNYESGVTLSGFAIARMVGHIGFLSPHSMDEKFGRNYVEQDGLYELFGKFQIERYLDYNGYNFTKKFDPISYLYLMKAINIFDLSSGYDSLDDALSNIKSKLHLISFESDFFFFKDEMKFIKDRMDAIGSSELCTYYNVDSDYGHDAFLVEVEKFNQYIVDILEK